MKKRKLIMLILGVSILSSCSLFQVSTNQTKTSTNNETTTLPSTNTTVVPSKATTVVSDDATAQYYDDLFLDVFDLNNKVDINIDISDSELKKINDDIMRNTYRIANTVEITITYPNGNVLSKSIDEVGIRLKGNTSRTSFLDGNVIDTNANYKLSFDETFDDEEEYSESERKVWTDTNLRKKRKDRTFFGLSKLELKFNREGDASYSRDIYAAQVYKQNGIYAQKTTLGTIDFINQQTKGNVSRLYKIYEPVDKLFVERYFDSNNISGDLYKATYGSNCGMPTLNQTSNKAYGVDNELYKNDKKVTYDLKTNKKKSTHEMMKAFLGYINSNASDLSSTLKDYMDEDYFYTFMAIQYLSGDWDNFLYDSNNYFLYFADNGKAYFIPYDMDRCFGIQAKYHNMVVLSYEDYWNLQGDNNKSQLLTKTIFRNNSEAKTKFITKIKEIAPSVLNIDNFKNSTYNYIYNNYKDIDDINLGNAPADANNAPESYFEKKLNKCL